MKSYAHESVHKSGARSARLRQTLGNMKIGGHEITWSTYKTDSYRPLHDYSVTEVEVIKIDVVAARFSFVVKINRRDNTLTWLGPGLAIGENPEIGINSDDCGKCLYMRPKLTRIRGESIENGDVERIVQWLYSDRFKPIESLYYNYPKGDRV